MTKNLAFIAAFLAVLKAAVFTFLVFLVLLVLVLLLLLLVPVLPLSLPVLTLPFAGHFLTRLSGFGCRSSPVSAFTQAAHACGHTRTRRLVTRTWRTCLTDVCTTAVYGRGQTCWRHFHRSVFAQRKGYEPIPNGTNHTSP